MRFAVGCCLAARKCIWGGREGGGGEAGGFG
jgi:hypothetical protein